jgi:phytoene synthase
MSDVRSAELAAAYAHCRAVAKREAKNFYYSFVALPRHKSDAMCAVYAFMRKADDLADDESMTLEARREAMAAWTAEWRDSRHRTSHDPVGDPVFCAVNDVQQRFGISDELFDQLIAGTTMDLQPQLAGIGHAHIAVIRPDGHTTDYDYDIYDNFDALYRYCYLVASVVGLVCIRIFGYSDKRAEEYAEQTGIAFQLTNILRDVKEDAERGRIYLPTEDIHQTGGDVEAVRRACAGEPMSPGVRDLMQLQIDRAQEYYKSGYRLIPLLDRDAQPAMRVLITIYHRLLEKIAAEPEAVFRERVSVATAEKLRILAVGMAQAFAARMSG